MNTGAFRAALRLAPRREGLQAGCTYRGGVLSAQATLAFNRQLKAQGAYQTGADGCAPRCEARTHDQQGRGTAPICHTGARPHA